MTPKTEPGSTPTILADCPGHPNCVSSQAQRASRRVEPFSCIGSCRETLQRLHEVLQSTPGASIVESTDSYLRVEFTTMIFGFVDDLELLADNKEKTVHVRSASRTGTWDLGANRRRVERLRRHLARALP